MNTDIEVYEAVPRIPQGEALRNRFLRSYREDTKTRDAYRRDLTHWYAYCDDTGLDPMAARRVHIEDWVRQVEVTPTRTGKPPKPATVHRMVSAVRCLYTYAKEHELLTDNPVPSGKSLNLAKVPTVSTTQSLTQDEAGRFLAAALERGPQAAAIAAVLLYQAVRVGGLCKLDVEDLSTEQSHRTIMVELKGGDFQVQALAPAAAVHVDAWLGSRANPAAGTELVHRSPAADGETPLFVDTHGERIKYWNVEHIVRACAKAAEVSKKLSPHSMRHTCITHLLDKGVPLRDVQVLAGHVHPSTTIRYDRRRENLNNSPVYKINGDFG